MTPALALENLVVGYKGRWGKHRHVLTNVSGEAKAGELIALVGPNGAGKSTLIRSIAGLQDSFSGSIYLNGKNMAQLNRRQIARSLAVVLTDRFDAERLRVKEVVAMGRHPYSSAFGRLNETDHRIVSSALEDVGATHLTHAELGSLSDGQRQRVMVARALAQEPKVLLLDEPTAFLDPPGRVSLIGLIRRLCRQRSIAALMCTHDIEGVLHDADLVWVAGKDGSMSTGTPEDLALSGALVAPFATPGVTFDARTLVFAPDRIGQPTAVVCGDDLEASLAARAIQRAGFDATTGTEIPQGAIWATRSSDGWVIHHPGGLSEPQTTLAGLHRVAAKLNGSFLPGSANVKVDE